MNMVTGGNDVSVAFGPGTINLDNGNVDLIGEKGNSTMEDVGYALGILTAASDYVDYKASLKAKLRGLAKRKPFDGDEVCRIEDAKPSKGWFGKLISHGNFAGPSGDINPEWRWKTGIDAIDKLDLEALYHDIGYYYQGTDGIPGALLSKRVLSIDKALVRGARDILKNSTNLATGGHLYTQSLNVLFTGIIGLKTTISFSYLYPFNIKK